MALALHARVDLKTCANFLNYALKLKIGGSGEPKEK